MIGAARDKLVELSAEQMSPTRRGLAWLLASAFVAWGCGRLAAEEPLAWVRTGIALANAGQIAVSQGGRPLDCETIGLGDGRQLVRFPWTPQTLYRIEMGETVVESHAPRRPLPYLVRRIALEDVSRAALSGVAPDSIVKFAPDSRRLAIGTLTGRLRIVDGYTGQMLFEDRLPEGMIKSLAWAPDGSQLYVGEQSPDANLVAYATPHPRDMSREARYAVAWRQRLADRIDTSLPPAGDRYGVYTLPAVHDLEVADDGRIFAAATHNWSRGGTLVNRSCLICLTPDGAEQWAVPRAGALELTISHMAIDSAGRKLLALPHRTQPPPATEGPLRPGALALVDGLTGALFDAYAIGPLEPYFTQVQSWDSVTLAGDGSRAAIGLADGRALLFDTTVAGLRLIEPFDLATPRLVGTIPITAGCSYARIFGDRLYLQTQNTHIPFGSAQAANQAPAPHRGANSLTVADLDGHPLWRYRGPFHLTGNWADRSGPGENSRWLLVTCRERPGATEPGQFGCLLFNLHHPGGGNDKLTYYYPTVGPVIFHADISRDGRLIAVVETPAPTPDGHDLYGTHQVHVVH